MARSSRPSTNLLARVRAWFGLDQPALALYLGVSPALVSSVEAGRRRLTPELLLALRPLVQHLPPAEAPAPTPAALP
ncbi:helix-turn-helix domain-containing protein, partial [Hymenobacter daeguensis]